MKVSVKNQKKFGKLVDFEKIRIGQPFLCQGATLESMERGGLVQVKLSKTTYTSINGTFPPMTWNEKMDGKVRPVIIIGAVMEAL
jgi:hypothetical protein